MTPKQWRRRADKLVRTLNVAKHEAGQIGLFKTMHGIDVGTKAIGWEMAELLSNETALKARIGKS